MNNRNCRRYSTLKCTCEHCGKVFSPYLGRPHQRFCQNACYLASNKVKTVGKACAECQQSFTVPASIAYRYTVCSLKCRYKATKYQKCERCGKPFTAERRLNRHYCSETCRRPAHQTTCKNCGEVFRIQPSSPRTFCKFACYRRYTGETSIEAAMRGALDDLGLGYVREMPIGRYSADFAIVQSKIIIEADGKYWHDPVKDARRDRLLAHYGWTTYRFGEAEIKANTDLPGLIKSRLNLASLR